MNAHSPRLSIADALAAFAGQDLATYNRIYTVADNIALCANRCGDFPALASDIALLKQFVDFLAGEAALQAVGIVPDLGAADAVYRDPDCERFELTGEVV